MDRAQNGDGGDGQDGRRRRHARALPAPTLALWRSSRSVCGEMPQQEQRPPGEGHTLRWSISVWERGLCNFSKCGANICPIWDNSGRDRQDLLEPGRVWTKSGPSRSTSGRSRPTLGPARPNPAKVCPGSINLRPTSADLGRTLPNVAKFATQPAKFDQFLMDFDRCWIYIGRRCPGVPRVCAEIEQIWVDIGEVSAAPNAEAWAPARRHQASRLPPAACRMISRRA